MTEGKFNTPREQMADWFRRFTAQEKELAALKERVAKLEGADVAETEKTS